MQETHKRVLGLLKVGAENPQTASELSSILKISKRRLMYIINILITRYGVPIVANRTGAKRGFFIAENQAELLNGICSLYNQNKEEEKRLSALMNADLKSYKKLLKG